MATSQARERLLAAAIDQAVRGGVTDQSLRELAAAIGTSHRMLLYHFGSREGLLVAISNAINEAEAAALDTWEDPQQLWQYFTDPKMWPAERLFFELYVHALHGRPGTEGFFEASVEAWLTALAGQWAAAGADEATARIMARLGLAVARGLLLDLLATGDRDGVTQAYEHYLQVVEAHYPATAARLAEHPPAGPDIAKGSGRR
jgi:AcrR family transcriptional regulator